MKQFVALLTSMVLAAFCSLVAIPFSQSQTSFLCFQDLSSKIADAERVVDENAVKRFTASNEQIELSCQSVVANATRTQSTEFTLPAEQFSASTLTYKMAIVELDWRLRIVEFAAVLVMLLVLLIILISLVSILIDYLKDQRIDLEQSDTLIHRFSVNSSTYVVLLIYTLIIFGIFIDALAISDSIQRVIFPTLWTIYMA